MKSLRGADCIKEILFNMSNSAGDVSACRSKYTARQRSPKSDLIYASFPIQYNPDKSAPVNPE
ncbi:hypothetical protein J6590_068377, partial [Homalodisca vitripennis]